MTFHLVKIIQSKQVFLFNGWETISFPGFPVSGHSWKGKNAPTTHFSLKGPQGISHQNSPDRWRERDMFIRSYPPLGPEGQVHIPSEIDSKGWKNRGYVSYQEELSDVKKNSNTFHSILVVKNRDIPKKFLNNQGLKKKSSKRY